MANVKLSAIAGAGAIAGADTIVGVQSGTTDVQYTYTNAAAFYAAATNTLTNKTYDTAGAGNVFKINGTGITSVTGTGGVVLSSAPVLTTMSFRAAGVTPLAIDMIFNVNGTDPLLDALLNVTPSAVNAMRITGDQDRQPKIWIQSWGNSKPAIAFIAGNGTPLAQTALSSGSGLGSITFHGTDGSGTFDSAPQSQISVKAAALWSGTSRPTTLNLFTTPIGGTATLSNVTLFESGGFAVGNFSGNVDPPNLGAGTAFVLNGVSLGLTAAQAAAYSISPVTGTATFAGGTSGATVLQPSAVASGTLTLPAATDTIAVLAASQAFTNKTYNGLTVTASTGTLTITNGKTLTANNTLTFVGTDGSTLTIGSGGTLGTAAFVNTGTSGATIPLLNAANTFSAVQVISTNAGTPPAPSTNTKLQIAGTDANSCILEIDAYGAGGTNTPNIIQRRFSGTAASPTATQAGGVLGNNVFGGYDGSALQSGAIIRATTINLWSGSDRSAFIDFQVTASGSTSITNQMRLQGSGGLSVGNANVATDDGAGGIRATKYNLVTITAPATGSTLTIADGKTATVNNTLTLAGTDATTMTFPTTSATIARTDAANTFTGTQSFSGAINATFNSTAAVNLTNNNGGIGFRNANTFIVSPAAAQTQHGSLDAASPVAQTVSFQSVVAGNANTAGANATIQGSLSNGSGAGGDLIFKTTASVAGSGTQNAAATSLTLKGGTQAVVVGSGNTFQIGNAATTGLTAGVLAATTNASIVITDSTGQAYRIPCII